MSVPKHVAVIPDGNRRWATAQGLPAWEGHIEGVKRFWEIANHALQEGVSYISFWGSSYDNLKKRTKMEVSFLLQLVAKEVANPEVLALCLNNQTRFRVIGEWREFITDTKVYQAIEDIQVQTKHFTDRGLTILFAYDGQREMLSAINALSEKPADIHNLRARLWTGELPDVDLVIRTGGEPHWSAGFMMWLIANSQFYFTQKLWPDFVAGELDRALLEYSERERRLGK